VKETPLRILIAEDSPDDAAMLLRALHAGGYLPQHRVVNTGPDMLAALESQDWDLVISDHNMPGFGAMEALKIVRQRDIDIPFIVFSGSIGEEAAVTLLKAGAQDFVIKDKMARLLPAVERELREARYRMDRRRAHATLAKSEHRLAEAQRLARRPRHAGQKRTPPRRSPTAGAHWKLGLRCGHAEIGVVG
jgi:CheY-like chemotaxis protein